MTIREIAPPTTLDGVTFTFEEGKCGVYCSSHRWWMIGYGSVYGFYDGRDDIVQRIKVCPVGEATFTVADFLESEELHRDLEARAKGRIRTQDRHRVWLLEQAAPRLLEACKVLLPYVEEEWVGRWCLMNGCNKRDGHHSARCPIGKAKVAIAAATEDPNDVPESSSG